MIKGTFSENVKVTMLYHGLANAVDVDIVDMSEFNYGAFVILHTGAGDTDLTFTLYEADTVAPANEAAITTTVPIYINLDPTAADVLSKTTSAYAYTINTGVAPNQMVVFEIDPSILSQGYPCCYPKDDDGGNVGNYVTVLFIGDPKTKGATLASAIA